MDYLLNTKIGQMIFAVILLVAVVLILMLLASLADRIKGRGREVASVAVFLGPGLLLLALGLIYPAVRTIIMSFMDRRSENWVGFDNYAWMFTATDSKQAFINTFIWVLLVPIVSTVVGLLYAILIDGKRFEKIAKSLLFMPMAISFVGAGIIWKFVYEYRGASQTQRGLLNAIIVGLGGEPVRFLQDSPLNTIFLLVVMIWIQAGFAMVLLSAAIKAIPHDIVEAAQLDGVNSWQMFRNITVPAIRPTLVVVLTTITIATLKIFDITQTMTGAKFGTQVLANMMYDQSFTYGNNGYGSAMAVAIFVLVIPIVIYNVRQMLINKEVRGG
ncbi:MAG: sugar ABC transporter permease [Actinomycetaceae bacterium]|nr:sugar ABC transporter permease [Actinomycetaceae bacterium]